MKKVIKIVLVFLSVAILAITGALMYVKLALPNVGAAPEITIEKTEARITRGKYLANSVAVCIDCHSTRDWSKFSGPLLPGTEGKGGERFGREMGFPGEFYARNITPEGLGSWSDGEILRAVTAGVSKDGRPLFPLMPHPTYGVCDEEDMLSIVAYIRSLAPIKNEVKDSEFDFPVNFIVHSIPKKASFTTMPDKKDQLAYGKYLFTMASCKDCHTKQEKGNPVEGMDLAGGFEFQFPNGAIVRSANITSDQETGIGSWTMESFVNKFKTFENPESLRSVSPTDFNTVMPWSMYATMEKEDLEAIFTYLKTVPAIKNKVEVFTPVK